MKLILSTIFLAWSVQLAYSQDSTDERVLDVYSQDEVKTIVQQSPNKNVYWQVLLNESFTIRKSQGEAKENFFDFLSNEVSQDVRNEQLSLEFPFVDLNLLAFSVPRDMKETRVYKLGDSGYEIVLLSSTEIIRLYNEKISKQ